MITAESIQPQWSLLLSIKNDNLSGKWWSLKKSSILKWSLILIIVNRPPTMEIFCVICYSVIISDYCRINSTSVIITFLKKIHILSVLVITYFDHHSGGSQWSLKKNIQSWEPPSLLTVTERTTAAWPNTNWLCPLCRDD